MSDIQTDIVNAAILAGVVFFTTLAGIGIAGLWDSPVKAVVAAAISAGSQFFIYLAGKRGLRYFRR